MANKYEDAFNLCTKFFTKNARSQGNESVLYYRFETLYNWISGIYYGKCKAALDHNLKSLSEQKEVSPPNSYYVAESHYCNAVFYRNLCNFNASKHCAEKANLILTRKIKNDRENLRMLTADLLSELENLK